MILSLLRDVVALPFNVVAQATSGNGRGGVFANILDEARQFRQAVGVFSQKAAEKILPRKIFNPIFEMFGLETDQTERLTRLRSLIRDAARQQLIVNEDFDGGKFMGELTVQMQELGFNDETIGKVGLNLNNLFAELRALPPAQRLDLLATLDDVVPYSVQPADAALMH